MSLQQALAKDEDYKNRVTYIEDILRRTLFEESNKFHKPYISISKANRRAYLCEVPGCNNPGCAKGLCNAHYIRKKLGKDLLLPVRNLKRGDKCVDCGMPVYKNGGWFRCAKHYKNRRYRVLKTGLVSAMGGRCFKCHGDFPIAVYDFHHAGKKDYSVAALMNTRGISEIAQEAAKCELLCANCHRIEHYES